LTPVIRLNVAVGSRDVRQIIDEIRNFAAQMSRIETGRLLSRYSRECRESVW
jgi:hypothetical protein